MRCRVVGVSALVLVGCASVVQAESGFSNRFYLRYQDFNDANADQVYEQLIYNGRPELQPVFDDLQSTFLVGGVDLTYKSGLWKGFIGWEVSSFDVDFHYDSDPASDDFYLASFEVNNLYVGAGYDRPLYAGPVWFGIAAHYNWPAVENSYQEFDVNPSAYWSLSVTLSLVGKSEVGNWATYIGSTQGKRIAGRDFPVADGVELGLEVPWVWVD
ncbi:hypothetical protein [Saccharospirillum sp. MSK14-1]|uniref:hypothetical protein n=1 Tax=Saccharospirillum sp. MSK14-1 TaxID=1897632 RepID=UPI0011B1D9B4|nr:hypothetical protein [Saccharospirillum sp. MSK14-1]